MTGCKTCQRGVCGSSYDAHGRQMFNCLVHGLVPEQLECDEHLLDPAVEVYAREHCQLQLVGKDS